jgi:hypothetical protein
LPGQRRTGSRALIFVEMYIAIMFMRDDDTHQISFLLRESASLLPIVLTE